MTTLRIIDPRADDYLAQIQALLALLRGGGLVASVEQKPVDVIAIVSEILADVARRGDLAAAEHTSRLDRATIRSDALRVPAAEIARAHAAADPAFLALVRRSAANIREYQEHIRHRDPAPLLRGGRTLGVRYTPIESERSRGGGR